MIVTRDSFESVIDTLHRYTVFSLDTETSGLHPYRQGGDRLFSIIIGTEDDEYYFNFNSKPDHTGKQIPSQYVLSRQFVKEIIAAMSDSLVFLHNAKYDMAMCAVEPFGGFLHTQAQIIHDTRSIGRVVQNNLLNYSLDRLTGQKSDLVKQYCKDHGLTRKIKKPGAKTALTGYHYDLVPFDLITEYGCNDARITFDLGRAQRKSLQDQQIKTGLDVEQVAFDEMALTKVLFKMENTGIQTNVDFVKRAFEYETNRMKDIESRFTSQMGVGTITRKKDLVTAFDKAGYYYPRTDKGNPCFDKEALNGLKNDVAKMILEYRDAEKKAGTYYGNMLFHMDQNGVIHCELNQGGTSTGRLSSSNPNLQNVNKVDKDHPEYHNEFLVRRAYIPREDYIFVMIDFDQMEYRMMLEYAKEMSVIQQVLAGTDVHTATANMMEVKRGIAKTINFMLLYGGGVAKLCLALFGPLLPESLLKSLEFESRYRGKTVYELAGMLEVDLKTIKHDLKELQKAFDMREKYFEKLPQVQKFIENVKETAKTRGFIFNWAHRKYIFDRPQYASKSPNYLIQGGGADVIKRAMIEIDGFLDKMKSRMLLQVHDELLFEIHKDELHVVDTLKKIMETTYPHKLLPLTCGVDWSDISWQDKKAWTSTDDVLQYLNGK